MSGIFDSLNSLFDNNKIEKNKKQIIHIEDSNSFKDKLNNN